MSRLVDEVRARAPKLRGRLVADAPIAEATWFRVGGPAEVLFSPADEDDLAYVLSALPREVQVTTIGLGSNLIVRDGGIPGLAIRLGGRAFGSVEIMEGFRIAVGAATPDQYVAKAAAIAGVDGLAFLRGVPGAIGGALVMNAGAHGGEVKDALIEARGVDRTGAGHVFSNAEMGFSYRHSLAPDDVVFTGATFQGRPGEPKAIEAEMERITRAREASQPIREKTGGSTFKNPPGMKAWELIDKAGCRGLQLGGAQVSTMHCNFLINLGTATAADLEALGEEVRRRVLETSGVALEWEIKRIGVALGIGFLDPSKVEPILSRTRRGLGEGHTEQGAKGQNGDHDPGFVDGLNQRSLFDKRLHHRERRALERASRAVHEHVEGYADKLRDANVASLQPLSQCCPKRRRAGVDHSVDHREPYGAAEISHEIEQAAGVRHAARRQMSKR